MITLLLLGFGVLSLYVYCKIKFKFAEKIPCVEPLHPIFGNGLEFAQKNSYEIFKSLTRAYKDNKRIFKLSFGPIPVICITHPDLIQKIMTEQVSMDKPFVYDFMRVEHGLLTAKYDEWRVHRKALNPTFNTRILNSFIPIFTDCVGKMISNMQKHVNDEKPINMLECTSPCTLEMICRTSLGGKVLEREGKQEFIEGLEIILHNVGLRMFNANLYPDFVYKNTRFYRAEMAARKICYAFTDKVIHEKRAKFEERLRHSVDNNNNNAMSDENGNVVFEDEEDDMLNYKKPQIFVDQLLTIPNDGKPFTHEEITDHIYTMIAAGNETSATQAAHACLLLAMHPEVQDRAAAEIRELLADDVEYTHEILKEMVYLERIIKESQRLCPVAAVFGRKTMGPMQLDEYVIPKGFILLLNAFALHRNKEFWGPNADMFDPDNFLPERVKARHPYAYMPFSAGPRGCIGSRYAMMSLKIMLSQILKNFKLTTEIPYEKLDFKFKVSMHLSFEHLINVFHEFERQNQESITAILRVLALVDHTLENTIQDCEKVFHLPSLDSENVLFRDVSRPLLLRVELLCQHVASGDLSEVEATMVAVEQEANSYRQRLDETKRYMQIVLHEVSNIEETSTISSKIDKIFDEIEPLNSTFRESIMAATGNLLPRQQAVCDEILEVFRDTIDEADVFEVITDFAMFLSNETELLVEDLTEQLDEWVFQTSNMINAFEEGLKNITFELIDSPIESFLQNESSLKCLAELGNHKAMHKMTQTAESMLQCFSIANDPKRPLEMVYHQLGEMADEVQLTLQDIVHCHQSTLRDDYDAKIFEDMASCFEMISVPMVDPQTMSNVQRPQCFIKFTWERLGSRFMPLIIFTAHLSNHAFELNGVIMFFLPAIIVVLGLVIYWCKLTRDSGLFAKDLPGPRSYPIIGCTYLFMRSYEETFTVINEWFRKYDRMFKISLGPTTVVCLSHPDLIQQVLTNRACQDKAFFYRFMELDYGLISSRYADWKLYRKMLNPAFNQRILISFISIFSRCSEDMVERMAKEVDSTKPFDMLHYTAQCTLEMVCASSLKSDITENPIAKEICGGIEKIMIIMCSRVYNVLLYSDMLFNMTPRYREMDRLRSKLQEMLDPIISERREEMAKERLENINQDEEEKYRKPMIFLDQLLDMKRGDEDLSSKEIENHLHTIIAAGSETSANQVAYILLQLAMHPNVQDRVYEEIRSIYGDSSLNISYETISAQNYLEQVIKETLRLFPVAPFIGRKTIETVKLGDVVIPPGVTLLMNIMHVHRSKELWGDRADVFDPDRFDPATYDARQQHPFSYIPFGGGPRNCIGYRYGMFTMKIMVSQVLHRYVLSTPISPNDSLGLSLAITLKTAVGHQLLIKRRKNILHGRREEIVKERLDKLHSESEEQYRKPMVFLDQLLNTKRGDEDLAMQEIENHIYTIIGAGSETSANQVAYILFLLAIHPDAQNRVYEEIRTIYGGSALNITYETISAQNYLEQVIKETMRLFPVAPLIGRETIETVKLGDVVIPPGVTLLMNIFTVHRNKELWGDRADVFDPDRFDRATDKQHPFSYIPFGGGPRNCIGYRGLNKIMVLSRGLLQKKEENRDT
ncbi:uncharacterized protein LOC128709444 [Anopheles marshallii]|uniref:uncharacterized protein LOC128709444 n=1 Tax=Anopheles marshallii TaxID=1521116 RepID=UPI00237C3567|nr:uncharacterized protein LOC128709444 [Anopheles marshallii]